MGVDVGVPDALVTLGAGAVELGHCDRPCRVEASLLARGRVVRSLPVVDVPLEAGGQDEGAQGATAVDDVAGAGPEEAHATRPKVSLANVLTNVYTARILDT